MHEVQKVKFKHVAHSGGQAVLILVVIFILYNSLQRQSGD
jgi:hypothetical protein